MARKANTLFALCILLSLALHCYGSLEQTSVLNENSHTARLLASKDDDDDDDSDQDTLVDDVVFENTLIDSTLLDIVWCGEKEESVLVLSENGTVYLSVNGGQNWKNIRSAFYKTAKKEVSDTESVIA